jgi:hypothetical protein
LVTGPIVVSCGLYFIFKISKLTIQIFFCLCQFEWIWLLKKVKFVSRTRLNVKLQTTSRYNFLSKITRSDRWAVSREFEYMSVRVNLTFEKSKICIENSIKRETSNYFSIQFSIENHLPTKERRIRNIE